MVHYSSPWQSWSSLSQLCLSHACFLWVYFFGDCIQTFYFPFAYPTRGVWPEPRQWLHITWWLCHCWQQCVYPELDSGRPGEDLWNPERRQMLWACNKPLPPSALWSVCRLPRDNPPQHILRGLRRDQLLWGWSLWDDNLLCSRLQGKWGLRRLEDTWVLS